MTEFDAVLFDAGGVLVLPAPAVTGPLLAPFGGTTDEETLVRAHFAAAHALDHARADGTEARWTAYHHAYARYAGVPEAAEEAAVAAMVAELDHWTWHHPVPGAREALATLVDRGVPIGIVSNAAGQVEGELARLGICAVVVDAAVVGAAAAGIAGAGALPPVPVACVVDSHVVGVAKPDPAIFAPALEALGIPASARVAYVGDTVFYDVRAAVAAGLTPLLHDPFGFHADDPHPSGPHRTLPSLSVLAELV
jgi:putative hydrolase of the HAD superfamily